MFRPKEANNFELVCTSNVAKDLSHITGQEYDLLKEKQDIRFQQLPNTEAVSGSNVSTAAASNLGGITAPGTEDASINALKDQKAGVKGIRKKVIDPESLKLREQKLKEERRQQETDYIYNAKSTLMEFLGESKPKEVEDSQFKALHASTNATNTRKFINKQVAGSIIGPNEEKKKQIVILSSKCITNTQSDVVTSIPKKIILKDLLSVMRRDPRMRHKSLLYLLQNSSQ